ncbi:MAG: hypothetical protein Q7U00_08415 [Sulfurimonas sp.]|nr:hypothetical protein [Sulfurimonas sp.]
MENIQLVHSALYEMGKRYEIILENFKPSRKNIGFTEQNMVHNYMNALVKKLGDDAIEWAEFPWRKDGRLHIDGIVFSKKHSCIFYIEAKRFNISKQVEKLNQDIKKIDTFYKDKKEFSERFKHHFGENPTDLQALYGFAC